VVFALAAALPACHRDPYVAGELIELNDNGAWSWFMDERVLVHDDKLVVGSVRSVRTFQTGEPDADWGNVEVAVHDLKTGAVDTHILFRHFDQDDHNNPSFLPLTDGGLLALYTKHKSEPYIYSQRSESADLLAWSDPDVIVSPQSASGSNATTYSNLFRLPSGRIANFYRGLDQDPNYMYSDDEGATWTYAGRLMHGEDGYSPYLKYVQDRSGAVHFVATEDHPRQFDNSLYHGVLVGDELRRSDGETIAAIGGGAAVKVRTWDFTRIFKGDPDNVGWMTDIELDGDERPIIAFSVQKDGRDLPRGEGDMRYHYARWDGERWTEREMAYAGDKLYAGEDDYTGLATIDPQDTRVVYISTNAHPFAGYALISESDGERHHELFRGVTGDHGESWEWEPITRDSDCDNLRPLVPRWDDERTALVWMRGTYLSNRGDWTTAVAGLILE
jgi:hypothetical protein